MGQRIFEKETDFSDELFRREINLLKDIKANFRLYCKDISEEEVKRLSNLIEIYCCLRSLSCHKYCVKNDVNRFNSLINGD